METQGEAQEDPGSWWQGLRRCSVEPSLIPSMSSQALPRAPSSLPTSSEPHQL